MQQFITPKQNYDQKVLFSFFPEEEAESSKPIGLKKGLLSLGCWVTRLFDFCKWG
jgi:hypothetical protein